MASNYDPNNLYSLNNSGPQSGQERVSNPGIPQTPPAGGNMPQQYGPRRLPPNTVLSSGRYQIDRLIAAGGMGAVYKALDTRFNRSCAVKEMLDEFQSEEERAQAVDWFAREATLLLELNHPCIPRVRDFFLETGRHYLVMDIIEGRTLGDVLQKEGTMQGVNGARGVNEARVRTWTQQVCSVLTYLHNQSPPIIFRDLKPSNIMVTDREEIKLIDFGIARTFQSQRQSTVIMTIGYAPPEQTQGRPEPRSDLYALGATMHRMLTFHDAANNQPSLFTFPSVRSLRPDISMAFDQVLMRALAPNLEQRWGSAAEMEKAIINLPAIGSSGPANSSVSHMHSLPSHPQMTSSSSPNQPVSAPIQPTTGPAGPYLMAAQGHLQATPSRVESAYESIKLAFGLEPNNALVHRLFGQVFARRMPPQVPQAIQAYTRSLQLNPSDSETHKLIGDVYLFLQNQPHNGIPAYIQSLRLNANDAEAHQRLGMSYERTNQFEPALREFQEAARLAPKHPAIQFALGQLAMRMNQLAMSEQALVQVLILNPADHQTRFLLSQVYERENKFEEAFRECSYVLGPLTNNPAVHQLYQRLRTRLGR